MNFLQTKQISVILGCATLVLPAHASTPSFTDRSDRDEESSRLVPTKLEGKDLILPSDAVGELVDSAFLSSTSPFSSTTYRDSYDKKVEIQHNEVMRLQMSNQGRDSATVSVLVTHVESGVKLWEQKFIVTAGESDDVAIPAATKLFDHDLPSGPLRVQVVTEGFVWSQGKVHTAVSVEPECREEPSQSYRCEVVMNKHYATGQGETDGGVQVKAECESSKSSGGAVFSGVVHYAREESYGSEEKYKCQLMPLGKRGKKSVGLRPGDLFWADCLGRGKSLDLGFLGEVKERHDRGK